MRFYSTTDTGRKVVQGGSEKGIVTKYETGGQLSFITKLDVGAGKDTYCFQVYDARGGAMKIITKIDGEVVQKKRTCNHELDRYGKCINCGKWEI